MYKEGNMMFLICETSVHPGSGSDVGIVDMPIQREIHTDFPVIRGSSLKGALRDYFYNVKDNKLEYNKINNLKKKIEEHNGEQLLKVVFGPESDDKGNEYSSSISFTDARILFFPVKSLKHIFAYITCPMILKRFYQDFMRVNKDENKFKNFVDKLSVDEGKVKVINNELLEDDKKTLILEEYSFEAKIINNFSITLIDKIFTKEDFRKDKLKNHLVILSDSDFKDFVKHSTEIIPRIKIDKETGTAQGGALWYEENIPTDSIFYSLSLYSDSKNPILNITADEIKLVFEKNLPDIFQLGGNETIGRGLIVPKLYNEDSLKNEVQNDN